MCFHTLRKDKGIQNSELVTFKPEVNFRLLRRLPGMKLRRVLQREGWRMVNARLCETARLAFFFASPRHFDFLDCETETSKCFECERETFRLLKFEPQIWFRAMRRYDNELELACTKVLRRRLLL